MRDPLPKRMYGLIYWGLLLPVLGLLIPFVALASMSVATVLIYVFLNPILSSGMVGVGAWFLSRFNRAFRIVAILVAVSVVFPFLHYVVPRGSVVAGIWTFIADALVILVGWFLLTAVAIDCRNGGQLDLAVKARVARVIYVLCMVASIVVHYMAPQAKAAVAPFLVAQFILAMVPLVILLWTVQSARIRMFY